MSFCKDGNSDPTSENVEQEDKVKVEEASVNLDCVKRELNEEELEFEHKQYELALTFENVFGESSTQQRSNRDSLISFLDGDVIMKIETGTVKLEDVKEENKDLIQKTIEQSDSEIIQCRCCKLWLEEQEHLERHMLHCLNNYNRSCRNRNLRDFAPATTDNGEQVHENEEITTSIDVNASYSTPPTEIIDSNNCVFRTDFKVHKEEYFHDENMETTHSNTNGKKYKCSDCPYQTNLKSDLKIHLGTHSDIKHFQCDICKQRFRRKSHLQSHIKNQH